MHHVVHIGNVGASSVKSALKFSPLGAYDSPPVTLSYCAGLFDGDGCILISRQLQPGRKRPTYRLVLSLVQNCRITVEHFQKALGLQACLVQVARTRKQNRQVYDLRFDGVHALRALQLLQPYLVRKKLEAEVAIDFWRQCALGVLPGCQGLPESIWKLRESFYKKLQRLK